MSWRFRAFGLMVVVAAMGVYGFQHVQVTSSITAFLPEHGERDLAVLSSLLTDSELVRTWFLTVGAENPENARSAAQQLAERLRNHPEVASIRTGPGPDLESAVFDLYFPHRLGFLTDEGEAELEQLLSEEDLRASLQRLKHQLAQPTSPMVRQVANRDPLLLFFAQLERLQRAQSRGLRLHDGQLMTEDGCALIILSTRSPAFDTEASRQLANAIEADFSSIQADRRESLVLEQSAVHRFAVASQASIQADIARISIISTVAIALLFLVLFRSIRYVVLAMLPLAAGGATGLFACAVLFESVHGLTFAFGASLIGVAIDYSVHLINHHTLQGSTKSRERSLSRVWPALAIGGLTTLAGLSGLALTTFPGLHELAVFATTGVATALLATRWIVAPFLSLAETRVELQERLVDRLGELLDGMRRHRYGVMIAVLPLLGIGGYGLSQVEWVDSLSALNRPPADLVAEDERVRIKVSRMDAGRFVVAIGDNLAAALQTNDTVYHALEEASAADELESFRSLHNFVWSPDLQRRNRAALQDESFLARFATLLEEEGFRPEAFSAFMSDASQAGEPLSWPTLADSSLGDVVRPFVLRLEGGRIAVLNFVRRVHDAEALSSRLTHIEGAHYFDQEAFLAEAYGGYRERTLQMLGVGLLVVLMMVFIRYRRYRLTAAAFLPALLAAAVALGVQGLVGTPTNLMHLVGLLLVLSMGVDYGVFMVEHRDRAHDLSGTFLSIVVACLTTLLSFGLLAWSDNPALRAIGLTVGTGVLASLLLAPLALVIALPVDEDS